jgi:hypothetical protein
VRKNQIKNSNERENMNITLSNPVISRLANDYVMSFLHYTGENTKHITDKQATDIKFYHADGFGNLSEQTNNLDSELLKDMLFDWSHVRDSSDEAFLAMAKAINNCVSYEAKSEDSMLDFKIFVANYFQDLRRELDYYVSMEPDATSEIEKIEDELYHETQI